MDKPGNLPEYEKWLKEHFNFEMTPREKMYYEQVVVRMKADFENSGFWTQLLVILDDLKDKYLLDRGYELYASPYPPVVHTKPFESFFLKTFRKNILLNDQWPKPPVNGWIIPSNWLTRTSDVLRTLLVVKFLDGVEYVSEALKDFCNGASVPCRVDFEAREEGYYAAHFYAINVFEIPRRNWDTETIPVETEIQVTTQLQESIRRLLHHYYETRRVSGGNKEKDVKKWQWDYKSEEFATNYLGHILHYVEGMIMEIRDKQERTKV
jgi:hypothetical protein